MFHLVQRFLPLIIAFVCITQLGDCTFAQVADEIEGNLSTARRQFQAAVAEAETKLFASFDDQQKRIEADGKLKVEAKIQQIEQLQSERRRFETNNQSLPTQRSLAAAVSNYRRELAAARKQCGRAFDAAADGVGSRMDLAAAKRILAEKENLLSQQTSGRLMNGFMVETWASGLGDLRCVAVGRGGGFDSVPFVYSGSQRAILQVSDRNMAKIIASDFPANRTGRIVFDSPTDGSNFGGTLFLASIADQGNEPDLIFRVESDGKSELFHKCPNSMAKGLALGAGTALGDFLYALNCGDACLLRLDAGSRSSEFGSGIRSGSWEDDLVITTGMSFGENAFATDGVNGQVIRISPAGKSATFAKVAGPISIAQGKGAFGDFLYVGTSDGNIVRISPDGNVSPFLSGYGSQSPEGNFRGLAITDEEMWLTTDTGSLLRISPKPVIVTKNSIGMSFVAVPEGQFRMGSPAGDTDRKPDETLHQVTIKTGFEISSCEVTQGQYEAIMGSNPSPTKIMDHPVDHVSWNDAVEFCKKLSESPEERQAGYSYRLPSEAEWEYACRAGTSTRFQFGNDAASLADYAWFDINSGNKSANRRELDKLSLDEYREWTSGNQCRPQPVGTKLPNSFGIYDMHGNLWEWCSDYFGDLPGEPQTDPLGPRSGTQRTIRGGSFDSPPSFCRTTARLGLAQDAMTPSLGFRVVRTRVGPGP